jgi:hypothetical protein
VVQVVVGVVPTRGLPEGRKKKRERKKEVWWPARFRWPETGTKREGN